MSKLDKNPGDFKCPNCHVEMPKRMSMTGASGGLRKGLVIVCSNCAGISVLGDTELHPMSKAEFIALDERSKRALVITRTEIEKKITAGGTWDPYSKN